MTQNSTTYYVWIGGSCDYGLYPEKRNVMKMKNEM